MNVDVIYSHLESANFIASLAQFFVRARVFICRHHSDQYRLLGRDRDWSYRITYALAKRVIVYSPAAKEFMIRQERIPERKILHINLAFDSSLYFLDRHAAEKIKNDLRAQVILITIGNFNPLKRPFDVVVLLRELLDKGLDVKLILLGLGVLESSLHERIDELQIRDRVLMPGYVSNVMDYLSAATFLVHPSVSESSCVVIKEAGLVSLPVIVNKHVGDFDDYIQDGVNGFLVSPQRFVKEASEIVVGNLKDKDNLRKIGERLRQSIMERFSIESVLGQYDTLNNVE